MSTVNDSEIRLAMAECPPQAYIRFIFGVARSGKSRLLYQCLAQEMSPSGRFVVIDAQEPPASLAGDIKGQLGNRYRHIQATGPRSYQTVSAEPEPRTYEVPHMTHEPEALAANVLSRFWSRELLSDITLLQVSPGHKLFDQEAVATLMEALAMWVHTKPEGAAPLSVFMNQPAGLPAAACLDLLFGATGPDFRLTMTFATPFDLEGYVGRKRLEALLDGRGVATLWLHSHEDLWTQRYALGGLSERAVRFLARVDGRPLAFRPGTYLSRYGGRVCLHRPERAVGDSS